MFHKIFIWLKNNTVCNNVDRLGSLGENREVLKYLLSNYLYFSLPHLDPLLPSSKYFSFKHISEWPSCTFPLWPKYIWAPSTGVLGWECLPFSIGIFRLLYRQFWHYFSKFEISNSRRQSICLGVSVMPWVYQQIVQNHRPHV